MPDDVSSPDLPIEGPDSTNTRFSRLSEAAFSSAWVAFGTAMIIGSQIGLPVPADRFPSLAGGLIVIMAGLRLVQLLRGAPFSFPPTERVDVSNTWRLFWGVWLLGLMIVVAGLVLGGFVWCVLVLRVVYRWAWLRSLIYSAAFSIVIALAFPALGLTLPGGVLFGP